MDGRDGGLEDGAEVRLGGLTGFHQQAPQGPPDEGPVAATASRLDQT